MIDIREGDILSVKNRQYPVRSVAEWEAGNFRLSHSSFARLATVTAYTLRPPAVSSGKRGEPTINLPEFKCTPLDPVAPEIARRLVIDTPYELKETFVDDVDGFLHIIVEDTKQ